MAKYKVSFTFSYIVDADNFNEAENKAIDLLDAEIEFDEIGAPEVITVEVVK